MDPLMDFTVRLILISPIIAFFLFAFKEKDPSDSFYYCSSTLDSNSSDSNSSDSNSSDSNSRYPTPSVNDDDYDDYNGLASC